MNATLSGYGLAGLLVLSGIGVGGVILLLGRRLAPRLEGRLESLPWESGAEPEVHAYARFHVRYYLYALLFLAFDMEMVFMYPWAVVFIREGLTAFLEMGMFIAILLLGILYAWREGAFEWT